MRVNVFPKNGLHHGASRRVHETYYTHQKVPKVLTTFTVRLGFSLRLSLVSSGRDIPSCSRAWG
jgi:hypothetical protein